MFTQAAENGEKSSKGGWGKVGGWVGGRTEGGLEEEDGVGREVEGEGFSSSSISSSSSFRWVEEREEL